MGAIKEKLAALGIVIPSGAMSALSQGDLTGLKGQTARGLMTLAQQTRLDFAVARHPTDSFAGPHFVEDITPSWISLIKLVTPTP